MEGRSFGTKNQLFVQKAGHRLVEYSRGEGLLQPMNIPRLKQSLILLLDWMTSDK
jgi:hypothetical protein